MPRLRWLLAACGLCASALFASALFAAEPRVLDDRLQLELFAENPQLVTPTGIDVDHLGRVWVIESNTHFPPDGYTGHPTDRVLILVDTNGDGRADQVTPFVDGLKHTMSVAVKPVWLDEPVFEVGGKRKVESGKPESSQGRRAESVKPEEGALKFGSPPSAPSSQLSPSGSPLSTFRSPLSVFLATRREILLLRDTDGDLKCDEQHQLVHLETKGDYPHNGLAGIAFDALGWMYFGFGENLGADYQIIGRDGVTLSGGGEGGNLYRCRPDGTKLEKWATGFWNPHASCFDAFGRLFTVDNDPDSRPPCRLLHIIPGGDYGYRFRNGRKGTHPFTAWNGEIPGTLPMVSGTGEAPSGIVCYESDGFPDDYLGTLLVGTWGDHRIDQFVLEPKGASFTSKPKPIVQGDENFRPVGLAVAPDGSLFFSDWVLKDYKLHGKGRVWRLSAKGAPQSAVTDANIINSSDPLTQLERYLESPRIDVRRKAAHSLSETADYARALRSMLSGAGSIRARVETLWAISKVPLQKIDFKLINCRIPEDAIFGRNFDEVLVAAVNLSDTEQLPREIVKYHDSLCVIHPQAIGSGYVLSQLKAAMTFADGWGISHFIDIPMDETSSDDRDIFSDPFRVSALIHSGDGLYQHEHDSEQLRMLAIIFARASDAKDSISCRIGLTDESPLVRRAAVQWVGEERFNKLRWLVEAFLADSTTTPDLFLACLATLSLLDGVPPSEFEKTPPTQYALAMVVDDQRPAPLRATALRMLPAAFPELKTDLLVKLAQSSDPALQTEAVRTLQQSPRREALPVLLQLANDAAADVSLRAEAISALCGLVPHEQPLPAEVESLLSQFAVGRLPLSGPNDSPTVVSTLQLEAIRALRGRAQEGSEIGRALRVGREAASGDRVLREAFDVALTGKSTVDPQPLSGPEPSTLNPQPSSGRRVFFSHQGPLCFKCHTVQGRGGNVGPDLSVIARTMDRQKLLDSLLDPSKEISPQYLTWSVSTTDGKVQTGIIVTENGAGDIDLGDAQGNVIKIPRKLIDERTPSKVSVMPQGLHQRMTTQELADLLAYLETLK